MDLFKSNLITLLDKVKNDESEEHQKNNIRDFLLNTYYKGTNEINTKGTQDLVIHTDKTIQSKVGVIIEAKRPSNKSEWITGDKINVKAVQELVLYYMRERVDENNIDIKYLIATNIHEWYIFDAGYFDKVFYRVNYSDYLALNRIDYFVKILLFYQLHLYRLIFYYH